MIASVLTRATCTGVILLGLVRPTLAEEQPVVVELFTSQGCSSCPPAEEYLRQLAVRPEILPLAFHVTYWDELGWRDPFALPEATARQNEYAHSFHRSTVYTPQFIVDGQPDSRQIGEQISQSIDSNAARPPVSITRKGSILSVHVGGSDLGSLDVVLVSYLNHALSDIGKGENAGKKLYETQIVRSVQRLGQSGKLETAFALEVSSLPRDATGVAVLVQETGQGRIITAVSATL